METCACALRPSSCESCFSATKLDSVFLVYTSDYNAIASFFVRSVPGEERREFAATVSFFDLSNDLCAFARSVLGQHGYEVLTTTSFSDAHLLAQAAQPSVILLGHEAAGLEACTVVPTLQAAAPRAATVTLQADFAESYANQGAASLLKAVTRARAGESIVRIVKSTICFSPDHNPRFTIATMRATVA